VGSHDQICRLATLKKHPDGWTPACCISPELFKELETSAFRALLPFASAGLYWRRLFLISWRGSVLGDPPVVLLHQEGFEEGQNHFVG